MKFIIYDRYYSLDKTTGYLQTFWRVIGNKYNSIVQLHEPNGIQYLNCFNQNIASLYVFCRVLQSQNFERHQLVEIQKQQGNNLRIFKFDREIPVCTSAASLYDNFDSIKNILMLYTKSQSDLNLVTHKEVICNKILYKICFNHESTRNEVVNKLKLCDLTKYPDLDMFIPFDDECETFLNGIFPTDRNQDNTKYSYMTVINESYMDMIPFLDVFHGQTQLIESRNISYNTLMVENRIAITNTKELLNMFLDNVPIINFFIGRLYENEQCAEFYTDSNEIIFLIIKMYIFSKTRYIILVNKSYQDNIITNDKNLYSIIVCEDEKDILIKFKNMYTNALIFNIFNVHINFIIASDQYKSNSYIILSRIIYNNLWQQFSDHCVVSEDGKCIRFNINAIILCNNLNSSDIIVTNYKRIKSEIYLPELYADSTLSITASLDDHLRNIKNDKQIKYIQLQSIDNISTMSMTDLIMSIIHDDRNDVHNYLEILESLITLSNKVRIPITLLYSLSVAQISYRLIFYTNLRNGVFPILNRTEKTPVFYQSHDTAYTKTYLNRLLVPTVAKIFKKSTPSSSDIIQEPLFSSLIKKFIPIHMTGNLVENYLTFFCPSDNHYPLISSLVTNERELLSHQNSIVWSQQQLISGYSIVSFDFRLFYSSIIAIFGLDISNCGFFYGFELKNFFMSIEQIHIFQSLPYTFIMDNDTLEIINIITLDDISRISDTAIYVVIMRFITTEMMQKHTHSYQPLSDLFYNSIIDIQKYKTKLNINKNILNSICGMLSAYEINTTILNVVYALSRKIIFWIIMNCLSNKSIMKSFQEHKFENTCTFPENLISIENDSFTFIYDSAKYQYKNFTENADNIDILRKKILHDLCREIVKCTNLSYEKISKIFQLKVNFSTGNLFQVTTRRFYYISINEKQKLILCSNEKNNSRLQKILEIINIDRSLIKTFHKDKQLKVSYLKRTYNLPEIRHLLLWYMMQRVETLSQPYNVAKNLFDLEKDISLLQTYDEKIMRLEFLFSNVNASYVREYFLKILSHSLTNINFLQHSIPDVKSFECIHLPSEKAPLIKNYILIFFKLYQLFTT